MNHPNQNRWVGLPQLGLNLARCERDIATHRLTLNTNAFNAAQAAKALPREGDTFLKAVLEQDAPTWLRQMDHDLEVLHAGLGLSRPSAARPSIHSPPSCNRKWTGWPPRLTPEVD